ncbi:S-adenosylmethionine decarboxylase-like protein [Bradyrhizobium oligotrophicum S58]|uniref:S-adenosylmethionine decarboxylase-like protein n=1 Tax=Bradyrhizobium oligotrophicum S58 TaxID=1245469 RepID=M4ZHA4_9BRAD|nr:S-adenosylmethionine decarboxylase [Bradyrhizobium oligotrophicum]BAM93213.1 S-adenosylmethionine decarboxylase-like protein [Bradyrhizobium oligotrophicum S58]
MILGRHIKAVGIGDPDRLRSMSRIKGLLDDLVEALNMRALGSPHIYEVEEDIRRMNCEPFEDEGGVTGIVVLSTSHCAIHTWPLQSQFVLDVFSCRKFNPSVVVDLVSRAFMTKSLRTTDLSHSLELETGAPAADAAVAADQSAISPIVPATPRRVGGRD